MTKLYLQTTTVGAGKSAQQIVEEIAKQGATQVRQTYDKAGRLVGLAFQVFMPDGKPQAVDLPCRVEAVKAVLLRQMSRRQRDREGAEQRVEDQAYRIAWRQLLYWVRAQFALVSLNMATPGEVFLPYLETSDGTRFFEALAAGGFRSIRALGPGKEGRA